MSGSVDVRHWWVVGMTLISLVSPAEAQINLDSCGPSLRATVTYEAGPHEVVATLFDDTVLGWQGLRLTVDLSASGIILPRGVWWVNAQPIDLTWSGDVFYHVWKHDWQAGGFGHWKDGAEEHRYRFTDRGQWPIWVSMFPPPGDPAQRVIAADGRILSDSLWLTDEQAYDDGWLNMASGLGVWGIIFDVQVCDDFLILEEETAIGTIVADFVTRYGRPPADGVWVQFYQAVCVPPLLDAPTPGRAGEVNEWRVSKLRPMDVVHFVYGFADGAFRVPGCASVNINIARPVYMGRAVADRDGKAIFSAFVSEQARGRTILFQALQRTTCLPGNVLRHTFE